MALMTKSESHVDIAAIMQTRRAKPANVQETTEIQAVPSVADKVDARIMPQLKKLNAKVDDSLHFLKELREIVSASSHQLDRIQARCRDLPTPMAAAARGASHEGEFPMSSAPNLSRPFRHPRCTQARPLSRIGIGSSGSSLFINGSSASLGTEPPRVSARARYSERITTLLGRTASKISISSLATWGMAASLATTFRRGRNRSKFVEKVWEIMNGSVAYVRLMGTLVLMSVFVSLIHTIDEDLLTRPVSMCLWVAAIFFDVIFLLEISIRFLSCPSRVAFCYSIFNLFDVFAGIVPPVCRAVVGFQTPDEGGRAFSLRTFLLCGVPILRLFKLLRSFSTFHLLLKAFRMAFEALPVLLFTLTIIVLFFSTLVYMFEPRSNIESYPRAMWLTIVTTSTVGYGETVPVTAAGYIIVSCLTVVSALYMAIPIGIVGNAFSTVWEDRHRLLLMQKVRERLISAGYRAADVPILFHAFDHDNDGLLNLSEFTALMLAMEIGMTDEHVMDLFRAFERGSTGQIDDEIFVREIYPESYAEIYMRVARLSIQADDSKVDQIPSVAEDSDGEAEEEESGSETRNCPTSDSKDSGRKSVARI